MKKTLIATVGDSVDLIEADVREIQIARIFKLKGYDLIIEIFGGYYADGSHNQTRQRLNLPLMNLFIDLRKIENLNNLDYEIEKFLDEMKFQTIRDVNNDPDYKNITKVDLIVNASFMNEDYKTFEESQVESKKVYEKLNESLDELNGFMKKYFRSYDVVREV